MTADLMMLHVAGLVAIVAAAVAGARGRPGLVAVAVGVAAVVLVASHATLAGRPRPAALDVLAGDREVVAARWQEGVAIWLWLEDGSGPPVSVELPWSEQTARQLRGEQRKAEAAGTQVRMRRGSEDAPGEWVFEAPPPAEEPAKVGR